MKRKQSPEHIAKRAAAMRGKSRKTSIHRDCMMSSINDIWKYVDRRGADECWNWKRGTNTTGYGSVRFMGVKYAAHRLAFAAANGGITLNAPADRSGGGFVLHSCDNRLCCNPAHLVLGTYDLNNKDAKTKGRSRAAQGADNPRALLTREQAIEVRRLSQEGLSRVAVARIFGVSDSVVRRIALGQGYRNAG